MRHLVSLASAGYSIPGSEPLEVAVFLQPQITERQRQAVLRAIRSTSHASDLMYVSHADAYAEYSQMLAGAPVPVEPGDLPDSFRFVVPEPGDYSSIRAVLRSMPGVHAVECRPLGARRT